MKSVKDMSEAEMTELFVKGNKAGETAVKNLNVEPMTVVGGGKEYFVEDGVCGFAWVNIKPGNSKFANFLKHMGIASTDSYYGGVTYWIYKYNQSMQKKEAYARAFAEVLQGVGITAYSASRMD